MITIAALTVRELVRRRVLLVLVLLTVASVAIVGWGVDRLVASARAEPDVNELAIRVGVSQVLILIAFMFSFVLAMTAAFVAAPAIAGDLESGVALALLSRPLPRSSLLLGRWLGVSLVMAAYAAGSGLLAIGVVSAIAGYGPPNPLVAIAFLVFEVEVILTFALVLGAWLPAIAAGAITVVAFGLTWFAGVLGSVAVVLDAEPLTMLSDASRVLLPTDGLWRGVIFGLEPPLVVLLAAGRGEALEASPFFASAPPPLPLVAWAGAWVALALVAGVAVLRRRDL